HSKAEIHRGIEEPARWHMIDSYDVYSEFAHQCKVHASLLSCAHEMTFSIRCEGSVGYSFQKEFACPFVEEFGMNANELRFRRSDRGRGDGSGFDGHSGRLTNSVGVGVHFFRNMITCCHGSLLIVSTHSTS